jgi:hypothetical protein
MLKIEGAKLKGESLTGRAICVGEKWSVIKQNDESRLIVWGDMTTDREGLGSNAAAEFTILPTYTQTNDSPAKRVGFDGMIDRPVDGDSQESSAIQKPKQSPEAGRRRKPSK